MDETTPEAPQKNNSMMVFIIIVILAIVGIGAYLMMNSASSQASSSVEGTVELEAGAFYYKPNVIRVKKGQTVKIVMTSADMMHDFVIDELNVKLPITKSGETNTVEFTADTAGEFEFYCSVGQHRANGQFGKLIVEE